MTYPRNIQTTRSSSVENFGLVPGLSVEELRKVHRRLVRRYHPDIGPDGSAELMQRINALHDKLKAEATVSAAPDLPELREAYAKSFAPGSAPAPGPGTASPKPAPEPRPRTRPVTATEMTDLTDKEESLGELALTEAARGVMSEALIEAVDGWLVEACQLPRNLLRRRLMLRLGRVSPLVCPALHMPFRVSMTRSALRLHFRSTPSGGLNLIALPALVNAGTRLATTGTVSVMGVDLTADQRSHSLSPEQSAERGFTLSLDGRPLPVELVFDGQEPDFSTGLHRIDHRRFRGLFADATTVPAAE